MNNRILWADQVKALSIFLMVMLHYGLSNEDCVIFVGMFHMPIFFFVSGYFEKAKSLDKKILIKGLKTLIVPYFFFSICAFSICWISPYLHPELYNHDGMLMTFIKAFVGMFLMQDYVRPYAFMPSGSLWFLISLFEVRILFAALSGTIRKDKFNVIIFFFLLLFYSILAYLKYYSTDSALMAMPIYSIGYLFKKYDLIERISNIWLYFLLFIIGLLYLLFWGLKNGSVGIDGMCFGNSIILFYINAIIGSLTFIFMFKAINVKWNWLSVVGASTLTILGTHAYISIMGKVIGVKYLSIDPRNEPLWFILPLTIIGIFFGVYCHKLIMSKIPWVLGK